MLYKTQFGYFDGDSWEEFCHFCLKRMYGDKYTEVPANPGDYGLDGFTEDGIVFQCYCPERECTDKELYASQRDKINKDIKKLNSYRKELTKIFGDIKVKKWILLTPHVKSNDLITYCNGKANELRGFNLDFVDDSVIVKTEDYKYINEYIASTAEAMNFIIDSTTPEKRIDLHVTEDLLEDVPLPEDKLTQNARRKHSARFSNPENHQDSIEELKDMSIEGAFAFDLLKKRWQSEYQEHFERFNKNIEELEKRVKQKCLVPTDDNERRYEEIEMLVRNFVDKEFSILNSESREQIVAGVLADWILRCPLDFK